MSQRAFNMFTDEGDEIVNHYANAMAHVVERVRSAIENLDLLDAQRERIEAALVEGVDNALGVLADTDPRCAEAYDTHVGDAVRAHINL